MRLGIDIRELARDRVTGIGRFVRDFVRYASQARPAHRFFLYGNQRTILPGTWPNVEVRIVPERLTLWWDQVVLPRLARADQVEVFLSPYIKGPVWVKCPLVITIHDLLFLAVPEYTASWRQKLRNTLLRRLACRVARRAELVLVDSEYSRNDVRHFLGLETQKVKVLPLAVAASYRPIDTQTELERVWARYKFKPPYILYLGNFKPHKNVQMLLRAFAVLDEGLRARYHLVLGGREDRWQEDCRRLAGRLGIAERVRFTGMVDEEDLPALYSGADLFVFPPLYEGFGLPPLEAMACGTAVVAANRTSIPEVVGEAGILVDPEDLDGLAAAIGRILEDDEERQRLEQAGLARAACFSPQLIYERQLALLEELAGR